jgi:protease I
LIQAGEIQARHWIIDSAETFAVDRQVSDASLDDYDALLLGRYLELRPAPDPRGRGRLRSRRSSATGKPVAAIRHRPWTLAQADVDELIVADGRLTTSRSPADLPAFCRAIVEQFAKARQSVPS